MEEFELEKVINNLNAANEKIEKDITELVNRWLANYKIMRDNAYPNEKCCVSIDYTRDLLYDLVNYFKHIEEW